MDTYVRPQGMKIQKIKMYAIPAVIFSLLLVILMGCATGPVFREAESKNDEAIIYIYRPSKQSGAGWAPRIYVDGRRFVNLVNGGYSYVLVSPGIHTIVARSHWFLNIPDETIEWKFSSGEKYFIRFSYEIGPCMTDVNKKTGTTEIKACKLIRPEWKDSN